jgi:threonine dehydratase
MSFPVRPGEIDAAAARLGTLVRRTPTLAVTVPTPVGDREVVLKLELLQHTGSFKPRGAFNRLLSCEVPAAGVIAASGGNHGLAVAHAARHLGLHAEIFVPETTPAAKLDRLLQYGPGVDVVVGGAQYGDAHEASVERARETGALVVHPYDQVEVVCGQGTMAREVEDQVPDIDAVVIAVGGGGLMAGAACWFTDRARVVAVEPATSRALGAALDAGSPIDVAVSGVAADSLGARRIGDLAFAAARAADVTHVEVSDDAIRAAQRFAWDQLRLVVEPGGAASLAALLSGGWVPSPGERVVVVVCGANTDPAHVVGP